MNVPEITLSVIRPDGSSSPVTFEVLPGSRALQPRLADSDAGIIPGRGITMAELADTSGIRRNFAETLQLKERGEALKSIAAKPARYAGRQAKALLGLITNSRAFGYAKGLLAGAYSFVGRQVTRLGRVGTVATVVAAVTSERGQRVIGKVLGTAVRVVDTAAKGVTGLIRYIPFIGKPIANKLTDARLWVWDKALDFGQRAKKNVIVQSAMHDGVVSRNVRKVVAPYALFRIAGLLPGLLRIAGYAAWGAWLVRKALNSPSVGNVAYRVVKNSNDIFTKRTTETTKVELTKVKADTEDLLERIDETIAESATVTEVPEGPVLAGNDRHVQIAAELDQAVMDHRSTNYEASRRREEAVFNAELAEQEAVMAENNAEEISETIEDPELKAAAAKRFVHAAVIAKATYTYFINDDKPELALSKRDQALKLLVLPEFKASDLDDKQADAAAYQYSKKTVRAWNKGEYPYDEGSKTPFNGRGGYVLTEAMINAALAEMTAQVRLDVAAV